MLTFHWNELILGHSFSQNLAITLHFTQRKANRVLQITHKATHDLALLRLLPLLSLPFSFTPFQPHWPCCFLNARLFTWYGFVQIFKFLLGFYCAFWGICSFHVICEISWCKLFITFLLNCLMVFIMFLVMSPLFSAVVSSFFLISLAKDPTILFIYFFEEPTVGFIDFSPLVFCFPLVLFCSLLFLFFYFEFMLLLFF